MKKFYFAVLIALSIFWVLPGVSFADTFDVDGYRIDLLVSTQGGQTILSMGRVNGDPSCKRLV